MAKISIRLAKSAVKSFYQKTFADDRVGANRAENAAVGGVIAIVAHTKHIAVLDVKVQRLRINGDFGGIYVRFVKFFTVEKNRRFGYLHVVASDGNHAFYERFSCKIAFCRGNNDEISASAFAIC